MARADVGRLRLAAIASDIRGEIGFAETSFDLVRRLNRHRLFFGAIAVALVAFGPRVARRWISRLLWLAPLALQAFRLGQAIKGVKSSFDTT